MSTLSWFQTLRMMISEAHTQNDDSRNTTDYRLAHDLLTEGRALAGQANRMLAGNANVGADLAPVSSDSVGYV